MNSPSLIPDPSCAGLRVLVAGASRGIGLAIADGFAASGASVSICAREPTRLQQAAEALRRHGHPVHAAPCDLSQADAITAYVEAAASALGGLDVVVNNASGYGNGKDDASWQAGFDIDLMAAVRCNRAALPWLRDSRNAVILNISSINALRPTPRSMAYSAAKAAINHYTISLSAELAREKIRVNAIAPGSIKFDGGIWDRRREEQPALYQQIRDGIPFGGFGHVDDIAQAALFLASPRARWITGQVLAVDGGQSLGV